MSSRIRPPTAHEWNALIAPLDQQFIYDRGRSLSLSVRFPDTFGAENAANALVLESSGSIAACLVWRDFQLLGGPTSLRGAMIGGVWTDPIFRRRGFAGALLERALPHITDRGASFAVLWSAQTPFYQRQGWQLNDLAVLGRLHTVRAPVVPHCMDGNGISTCHLPASTLSDSLCARIDALREACGAPFVSRAPRDYRRLPIPATQVDVILSPSPDQCRAYALVGRCEDERVLYEMYGDAEGMRVLWAELACFGDALLVNDCEGSASYDWLTRHTPIEWQRKPLALWKTAGIASEEAERFGFPYISWFDRI